MDDIPKVSVIIPHFNMYDFLPFAVESVVSQRYGNIELIVVDDGSREGLDIDQIGVDCAMLDDIGFKLLAIKHGGKSRAVNVGFGVATGDYLTILDADDRLPENSISARIERLKDVGADLCIGSFACCADGEVQSIRKIEVLDGLSNRAIIRKLLSRVIAPFHQNAMLFSRSLMQKVGRLDPKLIRSQDKDFAIRLLRQSNKTITISESVYKYHRYDRPLKLRMRNRLNAFRYNLLVIDRYSTGWRKPVYLCWGTVVGCAKLCYDLFWNYYA